MSHAALPSHYDLVLKDLAELRAACGGGVSSSSASSSAVECAAGGGSASGGFFAAVVEGMSADDAERRTESDELALIQRHAKAARALRAAAATGSASASRALSTLTEDQKASLAFTDRFEGLIARNGVYSPEHQRAICAMYRLPFPLPGGLVLQDAYFRPRMALLHGDASVNGDIIASRLADPGIEQSDPAAFHAERELCCCRTVLRLIKEAAEAPPRAPSSAAPAAAARHIVVLWGHFHCERIVHALMTASDALGGAADAESATIVKFAAPPEAAAVAHSYGWSSEMMRDIYGVVEG